MPETYTVKLSDGREFDVTTEGGPPSEAAILASLASSSGGAQSAAAPPKSSHGAGGGLASAAGARALPAAANTAMEFATSPTVPRTTAAVGRAVGAVAPAAGAFASGNPAEGIALAANAGKSAWVGGKAGYFTGKLAQQAAAPVASALEKAAPYIRTLGSLANAQGALEMAQMAAPERRDIGTLGIGPSVQANAIPTAPQLAAMPLETAVKWLTEAGWPEARARSYATHIRKLMAR